MDLLVGAQRRGHEGDQWDGAALLGGKAGTAGIVQPGEEKVWGDLPVAFQDLKRLQKSWRETLDKGMKGQNTRNGFYCQRQG
ncbi:hypothetical protein WISP_54675 [Willisornis vidua]|uniref:Uncharacterized protein n=1 Tax=Willisornis vidua TaxID=1566151 RepID=A0ABQ9DD82_9PASS|nr:hypothetical protein WISP_54675 [Willisornis vidua]